MSDTIVHSRRRILALAALLALAPALPALAAGGAVKPKELLVKIPSVNLEFWDQNGLFHMVIIDLTAAYPLEVKDAKIDKKVGPKIAQTLSMMTWEDFMHGNPAATVKAVVLDIIRKEPGGDKCADILVNKLIIR